jgi:hypothetical protein
MLSVVNYLFERKKMYPELSRPTVKGREVYQAPITGNFEEKQLKEFIENIENLCPGQSDYFALSSAFLAEDAAWQFENIYCQANQPSGKHLLIFKRYSGFLLKAFADNEVSRETLVQKRAEAILARTELPTTSTWIAIDRKTANYIGDLPLSKLPTSHFTLVRHWGSESWIKFIKK